MLIFAHVLKRTEILLCLYYTHPGSHFQTFSFFCEPHVVLCILDTPPPHPRSPVCPVTSLRRCECVYRCVSQSAVFISIFTPASVFVCLVGTHSTHPVHSLPPPRAQRERSAPAHPLQPHQEAWRRAEVSVGGWSYSVQLKRVLYI